VLGIAFQAGHEIGLVVAAAILAHDFADGLNTVNVVVKNGGTRRFALAWLVADALAPVLGAAISLLVRPQPELLCILLALFAGFFLYIGAADLLPESNRGRPRLINTLATFAGAGLLYLATRLV
jgi:ZIP family zinc transporter